jgi:hypothetical protein
MVLAEMEVLWNEAKALEKGWILPTGN